jgi:putative transposase
VIKTYRYKIEPNKRQRYALARTLDVCRELYNDALYQRQLYRLNLYQQSRELPALKRAFPAINNVCSQVLEDVLRKLDQSFKNFFRSGFGYPRYKSQNRYNSFTYPQPRPAGVFQLDGKYLKLGKIGSIKVRLSREIPKDAKIKTCTIKRSTNGWFASFVFEYTPVFLPKSDLAVGIDVGIAKFAAFSDGSQPTPNPRYFEKSQAKLRRAQRRASYPRKQKTSNRRRKALILVQKVYQHAKNQRLDFLHKESTKVIQKYGIICVEELNLAGMCKSSLAKQLYDVGVGTWFRQIAYKAESAGRLNPVVPCQYTSQTCPKCDFCSKDNRKTQASFVCLNCNYSANADYVGACNILNRGLQQLAWIEPSGMNEEVVNSLVA